MPAVASKGIRLDQGVRRATAVQTPRPGQRQCRIWPVCDRLQSDSPGQPAQARDGGGMNSLLPRGMPKGGNKDETNSRKSAEIEPSAGRYSQRSTESRKKPVVAVEI